MINLFVPGIPKGQPRPRAFAVGGKARVYSPATAEGWKSAIAQAIKPYLSEEPLIGPLKVELTFLMPRPKSHYRTGKFGGLLKEGAPEYHTKTPDADNLIKAVFDALTELRFWRDDAQVCSSRVLKIYANEHPGCFVMIEEMS